MSLKKFWGRFSPFSVFPFNFEFCYNFRLTAARIVQKITVFVCIFKNELSQTHLKVSGWDDSLPPTNASPRNKGSLSAAGMAADLRELLIPTTPQRYLLGGLTHVLPGVLIKPSISRGASAASRPRVSDSGFCIQRWFAPEAAAVMMVLLVIFQSCLSC